MDAEAPAGPAFAYTGPAELEAPVRAALAQVVDPEVAMNILDVGLVHGVDVTDTRAHVRMTMTSAACPVADALCADVEAELDQVLPPELVIEVELVWEPPWTPDRMSLQGRRFMQR